MITQLTGTIAGRSLDEVVLDVNGVGYGVTVADPNVFGSIGSSVTVHTLLVVTDDALTLYGFVSASQRELFVSLRSVSGVGPKLARAALAAYDEQTLRQAIVNHDEATLTSISGVGPKSAKRIIVELADRLSADATIDIRGSGSGAADDVRLALAQLGFGDREIVEALKSVDTDASTDDQIRQALRATAGSPS